MSDEPARVYSLQLGLFARDEALRRVELPSEDWRQIAYEAFVYVARRKNWFTTDAIWFVLEEEWKVPSPPERRAMGPVILLAKKNQVCVKTDKEKLSSRPVCHAGPKRVYRSLICTRPISGRERRFWESL